MSDNSYEEYKRDLARSEKKKQDNYDGKKLLILSAFFLAYLLFILPFHAGDVSEIRGDEIEAGRKYNPIHVYYIEDLHILRVKTDDDGSLYCVAKFFDRDGKEWLLCFTPGKDEELADHIRISSSFEEEMDITVNGYFQLEYLDELPFAADSFFSVYGRQYADEEQSNMLSLNADYLCKSYENYMLALITRPGIPLGSLVAGLLSLIIGSVLLIRNWKRKIEQK